MSGHCTTLAASSSVSRTERVSSPATWTNSGSHSPAKFRLTRSRWTLTSGRTERSSQDAKNTHHKVPPAVENTVAAPVEVCAKFGTHEKSLTSSRTAEPNGVSRAPLSMRLPLIGRLSSRGGTVVSERPLSALQEADGMGFLVTKEKHSSARNNVSTWRRRVNNDGAYPPRAPLALPPRHDSPVLQLIHRRFVELRTGTASGDGWSDGAKLGLVVEGGGMRGCVSAGALLALRALGLVGTFDAVYGASAGAINAAYWLADQPEGVNIYYDHIAHRDFLSLRRLWRTTDARSPPVLNLGFLIDHVMEAVLPLDWDRAMAHHPPLKVVASDLDALEPVLLDSFSDKEDLKTCLRASATVPEIAGEPTLCRGRRLVDAAVFEAVPFRTAIADGCTHVLVLSSRPRPSPRGSARASIDEALENVIKRALLSPGYMVPAWRAEAEALLLDGLSPDHQLMEAIDERIPDPSSRPWFAGAHVYPIYPGPAAAFAPICRDTATLAAGEEAGRQAVLSILEPILLGIGQIDEKLTTAGINAAEQLEPAPAM